MNLPKGGQGFTLVELAVAVVIIGFLIALVLKGDSMLHDAKVQSQISLISDLRTAVTTFKQRYHMLPGDFPIAGAPPIIPVRIECLQAGAYGGNGTGAIEAVAAPPNTFPTVLGEALCVPEVLYQAGLAKVDQRSGWNVFYSGYGAVWVKSVATSQVTAIRGGTPFFPAITHVIEFENLPCTVVQDIDRKIDDGFLAPGPPPGPYPPGTPGPGKAIASVDTCTPSGANDPVPYYAVAL
jgi:prepilin-type N-terminal cleavage/methylation domain-containing protein